MNMEGIKKLFKDVFSNRHEITVAYLYGSILKKDNFEDIDIGILIDNTFKNDALYEAKLAGKLETIYKENCNEQKTIDLQILNKKPLRFLFSVLKTSEIIYSRNEHKRVNFETKIMKEYLDMKPYYEYYDKMRYIRYANR